MKKSIHLNALTIICLVAILTVTFLPGCTSEKVVLPQSLDGLSLVKMWDKVATLTEVQNESIELQSFRLLADPYGKIDGLSFMFLKINASGDSEYQAEINSKGEVDWHSLQRSLPRTLHNPVEVLAEIDKVRLASLRPGAGGLEMDADFQLGPVQYSNYQLNIYQLENGKLLPLKEVDFNGTPFCVISVYQRFANGLGLASPAAAAPGDRSSTQIWFLSEDVQKAQTVEYLKN